LHCRAQKIYDYTIKNEHVSNEYEHIITIVTEIKKKARQNEKPFAISAEHQ